MMLLSNRCVIFYLGDFEVKGIDPVGSLCAILSGIKQGIAGTKFCSRLGPVAFSSFLSEVIGIFVVLSDGFRLQPLLQHCHFQDSHRGIGGLYHVVVSPPRNTVISFLTCGLQRLERSCIQVRDRCTCVRDARAGSGGAVRHHLGEIIDVCFRSHNTVGVL